MSGPSNVATGHTAAITDVACDSTGKLVATSAEDGKVQISEVRDTTLSPLCMLEGHDKPVLRIAWAHHRFVGSLLVSADAEGQVVLWRDVAGTGKEWRNIYSKQFPGAVTCLAWAPQELGLMFACGCSNGKVYVVTAEADWSVSTIEDAHAGGVTGVSWCPCLPPTGLMTMPLSAQQQGQAPSLVIPFPRLVSCGNEKSLRIWRFAPQDRSWLREHELNDFGVSTTAVRDVAWAPNCGLPFSYIAACSNEMTVHVWMQDGLDGRWKSVALPLFDSQVCRVSWSLVGTFLSVACANGRATLWKENAAGEWKQVGTVRNPSVPVG